MKTYRVVIITDVGNPHTHKTFGRPGQAKHHHQNISIAQVIKKNLACVSLLEVEDGFIFIALFCGQVFLLLYCRGRGADDEKRGLDERCAFEPNTIKSIKHLKCKQ